MIKLFKKEDEVFAHLENGEDVSVSIVFARPATSKQNDIAIFASDREIAFIENTGQLDPQSKTIVEETLEKQFILPEITRIEKTEVYLGNRYFHVETDWGKRSFIIKNPFVDIRVVNEDRLIIRDVMGNRFLIASLRSLDKRSRSELEKVM